MQILIKYFIIATVTLSSGCIPFMSNEQQTALWMSSEKRIESLKKNLDSQVGKEFYKSESQVEWCRTHKCVEHGDSISEFFEDIPSKYVNDRQCEIAWLVDHEKSTGDYQHSGKTIYFGFGKRLSWRYVSKPEDCKVTINFRGPW